MDLTMAFTSQRWYPIAVVLTVINLAGIGFAAAGTGFAAGPAHATIHGVLALACGLWAQRLRRGSGGSERIQSRSQEALGPGRLEALEAEMNTLRQELTETQERLDFAERLLARKPEPPRGSPQG